MSRRSKVRFVVAPGWALRIFKWEFGLIRTRGIPGFVGYPSRSNTD